MSETLAAEALKKFRVIYGTVRKHSRDMERACGVGGAQVWALAVLARRPGIRVTEFARELSIHPSTASNLLDKLERAGYLRRSRCAGDHRVVELFITEAGQALLARAPQPHCGVLTHALEQLPDSLLERLIEDLEAVTERMQIRDERAATQPLTDL